MGEAGLSPRGPGMRDDRAVPLSQFTLPETAAAFVSWSAQTGYDWDSPEWGEMLAALDSCGLLRADRCPQHGLFDPPDLPLGDGPSVRRLRVAILASARLHALGWGYDLPTSALLAVAVMERFCNDGDTLPVDRLVERLAADLPRRVHGVADSPSEALTTLLDAHPVARVAQQEHTFLPGEYDHPLTVPGLVRVLLAEAQADDAFAERVFGELAEDPGRGVLLLLLADGRCALYR